ncbi:DDE-type integrase/transposase/recombinase [Streptomyces sp. NPDC002516]
MDTFSRCIVGWSAAISKETRLVLDALEMALWQRDRNQHPYWKGGLIHHGDAGSQYTSFALAEHLDRAGIAASIGTVGDAYDNFLMLSTIGLFKTEQDTLRGRVGHRRVGRLVVPPPTPWCRRTVRPTSCQAPFLTGFGRDFRLWLRPGVSWS